ncbi:MAG TPA: acyl-CoA reductase, partial [Candidatus Tumulicola sp.]
MAAWLAASGAVTSNLRLRAPPALATNCAAMMARQRSVRSRIRAVCDAARRWSDGDFPPRVRTLAAIVERTGYSEPVAEYALDRLFSSISNDALAQAIVSELGSLDVLDGFVEREGVRIRAVAAGRACVISSRTTIGVAIVPAVFAICADSDLVVKDREDRLVSEFFKTLVEELPELRDRIEARAWDGESSEVDLHSFDTIVAFGDRPAIERIRSQADPECRFVSFGPRTSLGYVAREALVERDAGDIAFGAARDALLYDTEGCLSLRTLFVERGGAISPETFFAALRREVDRASIEFPPGSNRAQRMASLVAAHDLAAFRSANGRGAVATDANRTYVVTFDPGLERPPEFVARTIAVHPVDGPQEARDYLTQHRLAVEAWSIAGARDDVVDAAVASGAVRIAAFGSLQDPP